MHRHLFIALLTVCSLATSLPAGAKAQSTAQSNVQTKPQAKSPTKVPNSPATTKAPPPSASASAQAPNRSSDRATDRVADIDQRIEKYLRNLYAWGPTFTIKVGATKPTAIRDLLEVPVTVSAQGKSDTATVYVTTDGEFLFRGELTDMSVDPFAENRSNLQVGTSPSEGPADAKITLIEFADFECPSCRALDMILREEMKTRPNIRLVYKHFPLTGIHPWAMTAAIASQCAIHQNPDTFWKMHDMIFDAQDSINASNAYDKMLDLAKQLELNTETFRTCMAAPETAQEVQKSIAEGDLLNINSTPTIFVNGRRIVGADQTLLDAFIEFELRNYK